MKRILFSSFIAVMLTGLSSCQKDIVTEPDIIICYFEPTVPIRVITSAGTDLLSPAKLPSGKVGVELSGNSAGNTVYQMNPAVFSQTGQVDQYYFSVPLPVGDNKAFTVLFSLKDSQRDTLIINTAASSSQPFGVTSITFNGKTVQPKMLFNNAVYGLELVKDDQEK